MSLWLIMTIGVRLAGAAEDDGDLDVVLLGDSYSAGNGAGTYFPTFEDCHRSYENWASRYADLLRDDGLQVSFDEVDNAACSGDDDRTPFVGPPVMRVSLGGWSAICGRTRWG